MSRADGPRAVVVPGMRKLLGRYPHAYVCGDRVWLSGQTGQDHDCGGVLVGGGFAPQLHQALTNVERILAHAGIDIASVDRLVVQLRSEPDWPQMYTILEQRLSAPLPARTTFGVTSLADPEACVQVQCTATKAG